MIAVGDRIYEFEKHIHFLGEFRIFPEAVLVVVLQAQYDVILACHGKNLVDTVDDPGKPLLATNLGIALAGEHAADGSWASEPVSHFDQLGFAIDGAFSRIRIGIGEIRRAAKHRHGKTGCGNGLSNLVEIIRLETCEKPVVHLQAVGIERSGHLDPVKDRHRSLTRDLVNITLRKRRDLQGHARVSSQIA